VPAAIAVRALLFVVTLLVTVVAFVATTEPIDFTAIRALP
jgi:hypothetical protein